MSEGTRVAVKKPASTIEEIRSADETDPLPSSGSWEAHLLRSQQTVGNQSVQRLIRTSRPEPRAKPQPPAPLQIARKRPAPDPSRNNAAAEPPIVAAAPRAARVAPPATPATKPPTIQRSWYDDIDIPLTDYKFDPSIKGIKTAAGLVKDTAVAGFDRIAGQIEGLVSAGTKWLSDKWAWIETTASAAWDFAKNAFTKITGLIKSPLGLLTDALMSLDGQSVAKAWARFSALVTTVANGFKATTDTMLQPITQVWGSINGYATSLLSRVSGMTENVLFKKLPDAVQKIALAAIDRLKATWKRISDGWTNLLGKLKAWIDGALDKVFSFVRRVASFGINVVVKGLIDFGKVVLFLKDLASNPQKYIALLAQRSVQAFNGVEARFAGLVGQYFGGPARAAAPAGGGATIQRQPAPQTAGETKRSAQWGEIGTGISETMGKKWSEFKSNPMAIVTGLLMDLFLPMVGNVKDVIQLFKDIKAVVTGPLSAGSLEEFWTSLLLILDIPIMIYRTVISILMRSLMVPLIVATFIPHPVVKGIAAAVGWALLAGFVQGEGMNLTQKLALLKTGVTTKAQKDEAYNRIADSFIGLAMAAVITLIMLILHFIANVMKGIYNFVRGRVFSVKPTPVDTKGAVPPEGKGGPSEGKGGPEGKGKEAKPVENDPTGIKSPTLTEGPTADGKGSIKVLEDGRVIVCRSCAEMRVKYAEELNGKTEESRKLKEELDLADAEKDPATKLAKEKAVEQKLKNMQRAAETLPQKMKALEAESKATGDAVERLDPKGKSNALTEPDGTLQKAKVAAKPAEAKAAQARAEANAMEKGEAKTQAESKAAELETQAKDIKDKIAQLEKAIGEAKGKHEGLKQEAETGQKGAEAIKNDPEIQKPDVIDGIRDELETVRQKAEATEKKVSQAHEDLKEALGEGTQPAKAWKHGSVTKLPRQNIDGHQVEVHVDERGPHVHLDRNTKVERYVNLKGKTVQEGMSELPDGVRDNERVRSAAEKAIDQWNQETQ